MTTAINDRVNEGVLILNYVGHANERFLADEHVLDVSNINSWTNKNNLPIFVTATCEFSRFDDDEMSVDIIEALERFDAGQCNDIGLSFFLTEIKSQFIDCQHRNQ